MVVKPSELSVQKKLFNKLESIHTESFYINYQNYWNKNILDSVFHKRNSFVLDCGCGIGKMLTTLSQSYDRVYGLDLSADMIGANSKDKENVKLVRGDMQGMGFKDESFDLVICKGSLHHLAAPAEAIGEIHRILKKGGLFIISEPCRDNAIWRAIGCLYVNISKNFSSQHCVFNLSSLKEMLRQNSFEVQRICRFGFLGFPLCGIAHQFPLMKFIPFSDFFSRILISIDDIFVKLPLIKNFSWHIIIHSRKV